ncbi:hypothetical protein J1N10_19910 [Carboxylicivirga sp. A043]|nr:hypothetical protein [Carboxylicivirga sp. A043]
MNEDYKNIETLDDLENELRSKLSFVHDFSNELLTLIEKAIDPFEDDGYVYGINSATIIGLYTKLYKHFKLFLRAFNDKEYDTTVLLTRPIYEAFVLMKYLILKGEDSQTHYRLVSYRRRYKNFKELESIEGIGQVMIDKFKYAMNIDGFTMTDFECEDQKKKGRKWELDGKNFSEIHKEVEVSNTYSYLYGMFSEVLHSGWGDIRQLHLTYCEGGYYIPKMDFYISSDNRMIAPIFSIMIESSEQFLLWAERGDEIENFAQHKRINNLIIQYIFKNYESNPERYLYH